MLYILNVFFGLFNYLIIFSQTPSSEGEWSPVLSMGIVPVAAANLPDGRLITWASKFPETYTEIGDGMTYTAIFDPSLGTHGQALPFTQTPTNHDMFCPGINNLPDGRILVAGGTSSERTTIYDPATGQWTRAADMNVNRGYQGNVTLSDGSVFTVGGSWSGSNLSSSNGNKNGELYSPETGWISLPGILGDELYNTNDAATELQGIYRLDNHVWLWENSNGTLFQLGPGERMHRIDLSGGGNMVDVGQRGDDTFAIKGTTVMYDVNKVFKVGGSRSYSSNTPGKNSSFSIDISGATPVVTKTADMAFGRTMHNSTILPNGQILVIGGINHAETFSDTGARLGPELYDPNTNTWTTLVNMATPRTYHSVAILLTDGRVFVGGGGLCDQTPGCVNHADAEIFSPPYLFDSNNNLTVRPVITNAPDVVENYGSTINVTTDTNVTGFSLIRFSAATHSTNNEQRRIPVSTVGGTSHTLTIPQRELLPPGYYMLFAMDANGVPSFAKTIKIGTSVPLANNPNLVLELDFDETSGATAADTSGNNNNATVFDSASDGTSLTSNETYWTTDGLFGGAIEFDGGEFQSNSIVDIPTSASMTSINNTMTVMAWVNRSDIVDNAGLFTHLYPNLFFGFHNSLFKWEFSTDQGQQASCYAGYTPLDTWVHIAATYDGTTARLFANGVEICTKNVTGDFLLNTSGDNRETAFTTSGFYQTSNNGGGTPGYNNSGVIDELTGKLDEMKVFDKALGAEEIKMFFEAGKHLDLTVPDCAEGVIVTQYRVGNGPWTTANNANVSDGSEVYIRAITMGNEQYFITKPKADGNTYDSTNFPNPGDPTSYRIDTALRYGAPSDGLVAKSDEGQYVFTTASGCATVLNLNVSGSCDPGDAPVSAEWKIGAAAYQNGPQGQDVSITADEGQTVRLSLLPNLIPNTNTNLRFTLTSPNGSKFENILGDYVIQNINLIQEGTYLLESSQGCSVIIDITVKSFDCNTVETEYRINGTGTYFTGESAATIEQGNSLLLSIIPNGVEYSITGPNGNNKAMNANDLTLNSLSVADSGTYTFTIEDDCTRTISLSVIGDTPMEIECNDVEVRYSIDRGAVVVGDTVTMDEGGDIVISAGPSGVGYSVLSPEGTTLAGNSEDGFSISGITKSQEGIYTIVTELEGLPGTEVHNATLEYVDSEEVSGENGRATNALDSNPGTIWHTRWSGGNDPQPHEIQLDLGGISNVSGLNYLPRQDGGFNGTIEQYEIYVSETTTDWGVPVSMGSWAKNVNLKTVNFTAKEGRYVRLVSLAEINGRPWASAAEISVITNSTIVNCDKYISILVNEVDNGFLKISGIGRGVTGYDTTQDKGSHEIQDTGNTIMLSGNSWKKADLGQSITVNTVLEFEVRISGLGEVHGIGFENDNFLSTNYGSHFFQVAGTQTDYGIQTFRTYTGNGWVSYSIPVGQYITGNFAYMVFSGDKDTNGTTQESYFRNIRLGNGTLTTRVTDVSISPKNMVMAIGDNYQFSATVAPGNATNKSISWSSDNESIAMVDANGNVSALSPGTANITVTTVDGDFMDSASLEVSEVNVPVLTLNGGLVINLTIGDFYTELGATAFDDTDGDLTSQIIIGGDQVNTNSVGTYLVTYDVNNSAGNAALQVARTVNVSNPISDGLLKISGIGRGVTGYDTTQDKGSHEIQDTGNTIMLSGNSWKKADLGQSITVNTVLEFEVRISGLGEVHGIGFENDNFLSTNYGSHFFQVAGTQTDYGIQTFRTYTGNGWVSYSIPVGQYITGNFAYMVFSGDKDSNGTTQESYYRNIDLKENNLTSKSIIKNLNNKIPDLNNGLVIFPNPSKGMVGVDLTTYKNSSFVLYVFNSTGQIIIEKNIDNNHEGFEILDMSNFSDGIYYLIMSNQSELKDGIIILNKE